MGNTSSRGSRKSTRQVNQGVGSQDTREKNDSVNPKTRQGGSVGANNYGGKPSSGAQAGERSTSAPAALPRPKPASRSVSGVLGKPLSDIRQSYILGRELGRGQFGVTYLCTDKMTNEAYACKSIAKRKLTSKEDIEDVKREVQIMHHLSGTPNIVVLKDVFEDKHSVHLVMELCAGGELFDRCHAVLEWTALAAHSSSQALPAIVHRELAADRKAPPHDCCYCYANAPRERWPSPKKRPFPTSIPLPPLSGSSSSEDPSRRFPFPCSSIVPDWL